MPDHSLGQFDLDTLRRFRDVLAARYPEVKVARAEDIEQLNEKPHMTAFMAGRRSVVGELDQAIEHKTRDGGR